MLPATYAFTYAKKGQCAISYASILGLSLIRVEVLLVLLRSTRNSTRHLSELLPGTYYSSSSRGTPATATISSNTQKTKAYALTRYFFAGLHG